MFNGDGLVNIYTLSLFLWNKKPSVKKSRFIFNTLKYLFIDRKCRKNWGIAWLITGVLVLLFDITISTLCLGFNRCQVQEGLQIGVGTPFIGLAIKGVPIIIAGLWSPFNLVFIIFFFFFFFFFWLTRI